MRRRRMWILIGMVSGMVTAGLALLVMLVKHEPAFYLRAEVRSEQVRHQQAHEFMNRITDLFSRLNEHPAWSQEFTQEEINSYFQDELFRDTKLIEIPDNVQAPRVSLEPDRLRVAFRYGSGLLSTMISIDLRVWLVAKEPNVVALELCGFSAGRLPLGTRSLLDFISEAAREESIEVTWYRNGQHPVGLLRIQANQARPTFQLRRFEFQDGKLIIAGRSLTDAPAPPAKVASTTPAR